MFKCKNCETEMVRVYSFEDENYQQMKCPNCGGATQKRPIIYDDKGNLITNFKKNNKNRIRERSRKNDYQ